LDAIAGTQTAPAGATVLTSEAQFATITSGTVNNPNVYLIQGDFNITSTINVPSNVHIYVEGSIFKQGSFTAPGGVHSVENGSDSIFRVDGTDNIKLIGVDNALLHSNPNLQASAPHTTAIYITGNADNIEVDGFEIANVWEGVVARSGGLNIDDVVITNNHIRNTVGRAIWSLGSNNTIAAHNFITNAGVDGLDWDAFTDSAIGYENVVIGAGRWAGFVEEAAHDSYFIRGLSLIVDLNNPNRGFMLGWADNGTTIGVVNNSGQQTRHNYFIDNVVFDPGNIPNSGGDYFAKANTGGKGPTYFWANRGFGAGQSTNNFDNAEWLTFVPTAGGRDNAVNGVQLLADLDAQFNVPSLGDFNSDGNVDATDLAQWQGDYGLNGDSDANDNGQSDGFDFLAWQSNFELPPEAQTFTILDTDYTSAEGYNTGNLQAHPEWAGQQIAQIDASGSGTVTSIGGPFDRNMHSFSPTGGLAFNADDSLRITFDYQFNLSGNVNTNMANVGFRNEFPNAGNGFESKPLQGFHMEFNVFESSNGGSVKFFPDLNDTANADALILEGPEVGVNPAGGDLVSDNLRITYQASTDGAGNWTVDSLEVENLDTSNTFTYAGPTQTFTYSAADAYFSQQLAPNGDTSFTAVTDGVKYEYTTAGNSVAAASAPARTSESGQSPDFTPLAQALAESPNGNSQESEFAEASHEVPQQVDRSVNGLSNASLEKASIVGSEDSSYEESIDLALAEFDFGLRTLL
ncbi:MAG: hypothetical protein RID07_06955, partial [Lacipirellulaceae bacterium]